MMTRETLAREIDTARLADASAYDLADVLLAYVEAATVAKPTSAVPHHTIRIHPEISPDKYWEIVDGWLEYLGYADATWLEVAAHYDAQSGALTAVRGILAGRECGS